MGVDEKQKNSLSLRPGAIQKKKFRIFHLYPFFPCSSFSPSLLFSSTNKPNLAIHYNNYRCCKILCSILANRKKETIKKEITKTKFGLETNKDEMYYSVFENGSRKKKIFEYF